MKILRLLTCTYIFQSVIINLWAQTEIGMRRGINVLGYDSVWKGQKPQFTNKDLDYIRDAGFDTVRINMSPFRLSMPDYKEISKNWLNILDEYVNHAISINLNVILDYHDTDNWCSENFHLCKPVLMRFWDKMSEHYKSKSRKLIFEFLNEPHGPLNDNDWNDAQSNLIRIVRSKNTDRILIVSPTGYSSESRLKYLNIKFDDSIIVTVHYYEPRAFTMQFPQVVKGRPFNKWGSSADIDNINAYINRLKTWSINNSVQVNIGEFGVWDDVPLTYRSKYISTITRLANDKDIPWIYWQYKYDFRATKLDGSWIPDIKSAFNMDK